MSPGGSGCLAYLNNAARTMASMPSPGRNVETSSGIRTYSLPIFGHLRGLTLEAHGHDTGHWSLRRDNRRRRSGYLPTFAAIASDDALPAQTSSPRVP